MFVGTRYHQPVLKILCTRKQATFLVPRNNNEWSMIYIDVKENYLYTYSKG